METFDHGSNDRSHCRNYSQIKSQTFPKTKKIKILPFSYNTLLVCSNKSSIAAATSGTAEEPSLVLPVRFFSGGLAPQNALLSFGEQDNEHLGSSTTKSLAFLFHLLGYFFSSFAVFLPAKASVLTFTSSWGWVWGWDVVSPDIIPKACVGNWLTVHAPASRSSEVTSLG